MICLKKTMRWLCVLCALCVLATGIALADGCGIGDAAVLSPDAAAQPANMNVLPAVQVPAGVAGVSASYATENSTKGFVYRMYKVVLGREPDEDGFNTWVTLLDSGKMKAADLVLAFMDSPEYRSFNKNNAQIVTDCYEAMLNREPDPEGLAAWKKGLDVGMTFKSVCAGFVSSAEFLALAAQYGIAPGTVILTDARDQNYERTALVYRLYKDCLLREPDVGGLENWCKMLANGMTGTRIASGFVFSQESQSHMSSNEDFVEMLYRTILGRAPEASGKSSWVYLLDYTSTREHLLNGFMGSAEFALKCSLASIKVGDKIKEPDESREWKANVLMLSLVNAERAKYGLQPLKTREDLWKDVAMVRAKEVAKRHDHIRPDKSSWLTAYTDAGFIEGQQFIYAGENIAWGYKKEQDAMKAWLASPSHKENILRYNFTTLATGLYGKNWSQNFMEEIN